MAFSLQAVREALANQVVTRTGLLGYAADVDSVQVPCFVVMPAVEEPVLYRQTYSAAAGTPVRVKLRLRLLVQAIMDVAGQNELDSYLSCGTTVSVHDALEYDRTLGGVVSSCFAESCISYGQIDHPSGVRYFGAEIGIDIEVPR